MRISLLIFTVLFISGCDKSTSQSQQQSLSIGNQEVNCLRVNLGISNNDLMARVVLKKKTYDLDSLKRIHLPANASLCERRDFVDLILYVSQNQANYMETDPQVNMIKLAISGYEEEFLPLAKSWHSANSYINKALIYSLGDNSKKDIVRNNIDKYPWLIQVVVKNGWSMEFRKEIEDIITKHNGKVSYNFGAALAQINDPQTENLLLSVFKGGTGNRHVTYSLVKDLEWFDPIPVMQEIWSSDDVSDLELQYFAYPLLHNGFFPALDYVVKKVDGYAYNAPYHKNYQLLNAVTNQSLGKEEIKKWIIKNRDKLKFDPVSKQYVVLAKK